MNHSIDRQTSAVLASQLGRAFGFTPHDYSWIACFVPLACSRECT
jgi:hypothetical protein